MYFDFAVPILHDTFLTISTVMHYLDLAWIAQSEPMEMGFGRAENKEESFGGLRILAHWILFPKGYTLDIGDRDMTRFCGIDASTPKALIKSSEFSSVANSDTPIIINNQQIKRLKLIIFVLLIPYFLSK